MSTVTWITDKELEGEIKKKTKTKKKKKKGDEFCCKSNMKILHRR